MSANPEEAFQAMRPSDMRFEWPHALAEMVQQTRDLAQTIVTAQETTQDILVQTRQITDSGLASLEQAGSALQDASKQAGEQLNDLVDSKLNELSDSLDASIRGIQEAGADTAKQCSDAMLAQSLELTRRTTKLIEAIERIEALRIKTNDARMHLIDYRRDLDLYEAAVHRRCKEALAKAGSGLSLWGRIKLVFSPVQTQVITPRPPQRPS